MTEDAVDFTKPPEPTPPPQPWGPPGYGAYPPNAAVAGKPSTNIGWAIAAIVTFWPLAIPAFIYSAKVDPAWYGGRYDEAVGASNNARTCGIIAVVLGAILIIAGIALVLLVAVATTSTVQHIDSIIPTPLNT